MLRPSPFADVRAAGWGVLCLFVCMYEAATLLFFTDLAEASFLIDLTVWSGGWIDPPLVGYALKFLAAVGGVALLWGRLRPADLGLRARTFLAGATVFVLLWVAMHGAVGVREIVWAGLPLQTAPITTSRLVDLLHHLLGSALVEEVAYRGFLFPQLFILTASVWPHSPRKRLLFSLLASQWYFGLNHIPAGIGMGMNAEQITVYVVHAMLVGVFLALAYLRTNNLWVAVGIHALVNAPLSLIHSAVDPSIYVLALSVLLLIAWPDRRTTGAPFDPLTADGAFLPHVHIGRKNPWEQTAGR